MHICKARVQEQPASLKQLLLQLLILVRNQYGLYDL